MQLLSKVERREKKEKKRKGEGNLLLLFIHTKTQRETANEGCDEDNRRPRLSCFYS
jgi:hypothetical protein